MKTIRLKSAILILFLCCCGSLFAQGPDAVRDSSELDQRVEIIARYDGEKVILRWAPNKPSVWEMANYYGYRLERLAYKLDGEVDTSRNFQVLGDSILKPLPLEAWEPLVQANPEDDYLKVYAQTLYGDRPAQQDPATGWKIKAQEFQNLYGMAMLSAEFSAPAANAAALRYVDDEIQPDAVYVYKLSTYIPDTIMRLDTAFLIVQTDTISEVPPVVLHNVYEGEKYVEFTWERQVYAQFYSGYYVERSNDGGNTFQRLTEVPVQQTAYKDSTLFYFRDSVDQNYQPHEYRIYGITPFADAGPYSEVITAQGRDRTPPSAPYNVKTFYRGDGQMEITWEVDPNDRDIAGFLISKSNERQEGFIQLTPEPLLASKRLFVDTACNELINNYYFVGVLDTAGNGNVALPEYGTIIDSIPPAPPGGLEGSIDTNGVVTVTWDVGPEPDLLGYFVHFANADDHVFINQVGHPIGDTIWRDTIPLNVLTESIYYKVVAVDHRYNYSGYSEMLELRKPDKVPPVAPIFRDSYVDEGVIRIEFYTSTSHDIVENQLWRRDMKDGSEEIVFTCNSDEPFAKFQDNAVIEGRRYTYRLVAIDDAGLASESVGTLDLRAYESKRLPEPYDIQVVVDEEKRAYSLTWNWNDLNEDTSFVIYRAVNEFPYQTYKVVNNPVREIVDYGLKEGDVIRFRIKASDRTGKASMMSEEVVLEF